MPDAVSRSTNVIDAHRSCPPIIITTHTTHACRPARPHPPSSLFPLSPLCLRFARSLSLYPPPSLSPLSFSTDSRCAAVREQVLKSIEKERKMRKLNKVRFRPGTTEYVPFSGYATACFDQRTCPSASSVHTLTRTFFSCSPFLYAIAGRSTKFELTLVHKYDPTLDKWIPGI